MGEAYDYLGVVLLLHVLQRPGVLQGCGNGLFHVQRYMGGEHFFHIVQPLGGRGAQYHVVRLGYPLVQLLIAESLAAELRAVLFQARPVHIIGGYHCAAQFDDSPPMGVGNVAGADHYYIHGFISCVVVFLLACNTSIFPGE